MAFVRCYTGTDGQSRFEDLDLLPPDMERSIEQAASSIIFTRSPNGRGTRLSHHHDRSGEKHARAGRGAPPRRPLMPCRLCTSEGWQ